MADQDLLTTIRKVRGRWKLALVLRGAIITVAAIGVAALVARFLNRRSSFLQEGTARD